jgi:hypothetical protein
MPRTFMIALTLVFLSACSTMQPYAQAVSANSAGYSERRIEADRFSVTYRARGAADAALVQDYALLRAAELTTQNARDWFWVDRRTLDQGDSASPGPSIGIGIGGGSYGRRSGVNVGIGVNIPVGPPPPPRARAATLEIRLGEGVKPDDPNAYDAHAIAANIRARVLAPR